jgi:hypothetical protein
MMEVLLVGGTLATNDEDIVGWRNRKPMME